MPADDPSYPRLLDGLTVEVDDNSSILFGTPLIRFVVPNAAKLNEGLRQLILAREISHPSRKVSNAGGWQSATDFLGWGAPECAELLKSIQNGVRRACDLSPAQRALPPGSRTLLLSAWANINRDGAYNRPHVHPGSHWSGVYYVDIGRPTPGIPTNGAIEFVDPRNIGAAVAVPGFTFGDPCYFMPEPGMMLIFPSWLYHWVMPFRGNGERISIAFNALLEMKGKN
jgi:uncharacterized protein (TIGR02466 family)